MNRNAWASWAISTASDVSFNRHGFTADYTVLQRRLWPIKSGIWAFPISRLYYLRSQQVAELIFTGGYNRSCFQFEAEYADLIIYEEWGSRLQCIFRILVLKLRVSFDDGLNAKFLNLCCPQFVPNVAHMITFCLCENVFPGARKRVIVTVLPKTKSPIDLKDSRPISILPTVSKIILLRK